MCIFVVIVTNMVTICSFMTGRLNSVVKDLRLHDKKASKLHSYNS